MELTAFRVVFLTAQDEFWAALEEPPKREEAICPSFIQELYQIPGSLIQNILWLPGSPHQCSDVVACAYLTLCQWQHPVLLVIGTAWGFTASCKWLLRKLSPWQTLSWSWQLRLSNRHSIHHCLLPRDSPKPELQAWHFLESHGWQSASAFVLGLLL